MHAPGVSFGSLPRIDYPYRFFVTATFFVIVLAIFILLSGETPWSNRWQPAMLFITHGFTLGFITTIMMGALLQIIPVVGGIALPQINVVATTSHVFHLLGTSLLMKNFVWPDDYSRVLSVVFLVLGLGIYIVTVFGLLLKKLKQGATLAGIRNALLLLSFTIVIGCLIQFSNAGADLLLANKSYTNLHALLGGMGWMGLLILAVSFQIIPMFHVAPIFPMGITRYLPKILFSLLIALLLIVAFFNEFSSSLMILLGDSLLLLNCLYVIVLLKTLDKRKRKIADTTVMYWQLAAFSMILLTCLTFVVQFYLKNKAIEPALNNFHNLLLQKQDLLQAVIFFYFFIISVLQGMLLKILPFLSYTHLQQLCLTNFKAMEHIPHMHEFLNKQHGLYLFFLHCCTGLSLLATILIPSLYWLFGVLLLVEFSLLLAIMIKVIGLYKISLRKIKALKGNNIEYCLTE